jgi:hypothetical protein
VPSKKLKIQGLGEFDRDQLITAVLVFMDTEGANHMQRLCRTRDTLRDEHGFDREVVAEYVVAARHCIDQNIDPSKEKSR